MRQANASCAAVPQFDRLRYFYGQMLHSRDLQSEQGYFREKLKLHNRCLHGWGVVCGLEVAPAPPDPDCIPITDTEYGKLREEMDKKQAALAQVSDPASETANKLRQDIEQLRQKLAKMGVPTSCVPRDERTKVQISCGLAIDCEGNEIVLRQPMLVDLWSALSSDDRKLIESGGAKNLYLAICYRECPIDPVRPVVPDSCGATSDCEYARLRDSFSIVVTTDGERWKDERCEPCCDECKECCVLLARIDDFAKGQPLAPSQIHMDVRREISLRPTTRIAGINWVHDGVYTPQQAAALLGTGSTTGGIEIRFTGSLWTESITDGTLDIWVIEGGQGRAASINNKSGTLVLPTTPTTDRVVYRDDTRETLNEGDRVLITLRSAFLLDNCCRPVDGAHVGGRVPLLPDSPASKETPARTVCQVPPGGIGPWTSGAGGAANFESWFWIDKP